MNDRKGKPVHTGDTVKVFRTYIGIVEDFVDPERCRVWTPNAFLRAEHDEIEVVSKPLPSDRGYKKWLEAADFRLRTRHKMKELSVNTRDRIEMLLELYPTLNDFGIGAYAGVPIKDRGAWIKAEQERLLDNWSNVQWIERVLRAAFDRRTVNTKIGSYGLKHLLESHSPEGYITNGQFIAGALLAGLKSDIPNSAPNAYFNIHQATIQEWERGRVYIPANSD